MISYQIVQKFWKKISWLIST